MQRFINVYSTLHAGMKLRVLCGDNGRHFNHSDTPNTISHGITFGDDVAALDVPAGTELTTDYHAICDAVRREGLGFKLSNPILRLAGQRDHLRSGGTMAHSRRVFPDTAEDKS